MEFGYFKTTGIYLRQPGESSFVLSEASALQGTGAFLSITRPKIGAFNCVDCELVIFRYGSHMLNV